MEVMRSFSFRFSSSLRAMTCAIRFSSSCVVKQQNENNTISTSRRNYYSQMINICILNNRSNPVVWLQSLKVWSLVHHGQNRGHVREIIKQPDYYRMVNTFAKWD